MLAVVGIVLAHMANNLMNDLFDLEVGTDSENTPGAVRAAPVLSGLVTAGRSGGAWSSTRRPRDPRGAHAGAGLAGAGVRARRLRARVAYTAPPLRLKKHGLGEPDVFVVWGPLMVGGTYYSAVGSVGGRSCSRRSRTGCCARRC